MKILNVQGPCDTCNTVAHTGMAKVGGMERELCPNCITAWDAKRNAADVADAIKEFQGLEEVLSVLDQHAAPRGSNIGRACFDAYAKLAALRKSDLAEWNATEPVLIHRCAEASAPYHTTDFDGPCDVYTTNCGTVCDTCANIRRSEASRLAVERSGYFRAKQRGEVEPNV